MEKSLHISGSMLNCVILKDNCICNVSDSYIYINLIYKFILELSNKSKLILLLNIY